MSPSSRRLFAVIPAAGRSRRMGRPKLLLPLGEETVIARLLRILRRSEIAEVLVVLRPDDEPLRAEVAAHGGRALQPDVPPPEMRDSAECALRWIEAHAKPQPHDGWLLCPADHPWIESDVLDRLIARWAEDDVSILIPTCREKRGHPILLRWALVPEVFSLPADAGLNRLIRNQADNVVEIEVGRESVVADLDTPEDYDGALHILRNGGPR